MRIPARPTRQPHACTLHLQMMIRRRDRDETCPWRILCYLLLSMGRRDWRGAETRGVCARISSRPAAPRESRASGYSRGSSGCLLLAGFVFCCVRDAFFIVSDLSRLAFRFLMASTLGEKHEMALWGVSLSDLTPRSGGFQEVTSSAAAKHSHCVCAPRSNGVKGAV